VTFGSFNNPVKLGERTLDAWAALLARVPGARLVLRGSGFHDAEGRDRFHSRLRERGVERERVDLLDFQADSAAVRAQYAQLDIALDPFPYPGGTTSVEALWMGVPVITRRGDRFLSHMGETIARTAGLPDWIAADDDEYIAKAVQHTADLGRLATLRAGLRQQVLASPVFDAPRFARNFETVLWGMWQTWHDMQPKGKT
jgi:protein O-GlcNAc transferase